MPSQLDLDHYEGNLIERIRELERRVAALERLQPSNYRGTKGSDFTTTELPSKGDYGFQTASDELQFNCDGTVRAVSTAAL